jgi:hypothetical protein
MGNKSLHIHTQLPVRLLVRTHGMDDIMEVAINGIVAKKGKDETDIGQFTQYHADVFSIE